MERRRLRRLIAGTAIDISALRESRDFRKIFGSQLVSRIGNEITLVAIAYQVYLIARAHGDSRGYATFLVGVASAIQIAPLVGFGLYGGAIADAVDRRKLLLAVQVGMGLTSLGLAIAALGHPPLWLLFVLASVSAGFSAIDGPTRSAVLPMVVDDETLRSAVQLREVLTQSGRTFGPVIGAALIAVSLSAAYAVDALTFVVSFATMWTLPPLPPAVRSRAGLRSIFEGLRYVRSNPVLASTFIADLIAMVFGMSRAVFPAMARDVYHVGVIGYGVLSSAIPAGALIALLFVGLTSRVRREGLAVLVCVAIWGAAVAAFGVTPWFWAGLVFLAIAGAADMVSAIFRQTILYATTPDELRGRLSGLHIVVVTGGPRFGDLESGAATALIGLREAVVTGGLATVLGIGVLAAAIPAFARWTDPDRFHTPRVEPTDDPGASAFRRWGVAAASPAGRGRQ